MPKKQKINLAKVLASLNTTCPKCAYSIPPNERRHVDFEYIECPKCKERFVPVASRTRRPLLTSISHQCSTNSCSACPVLFEREETGSEVIVCAHDCHKQKAQFVCPSCGGVTVDMKAGAFQHVFSAMVVCQHCEKEFTVKDSTARA